MRLWTGGVDEDGRRIEPQPRAAMATLLLVAFGALCGAGGHAMGVRSMEEAVTACEDERAANAVASGEVMERATRVLLEHHDALHMAGIPHPEPPPEWRTDGG